VNKVYLPGSAVAKKVPNVRIQNKATLESIFTKFGIKVIFINQINLKYTETNLKWDRMIEVAIIEFILKPVNSKSVSVSGDCLLSTSRLCLRIVHKQYKANETIKNNNNKCYLFKIILLLSKLLYKLD